MKTSVLLFILSLCAELSFSQTSNTTFLTWMKGDNTINQPGIYGTKGLADSANKPGGRNFAATWKDNNDDLWLFGGYGYDNNGTLGYLNDLWKYDTYYNKWTWIKGDNITEQPGVYGTKGNANAANKPGAIYASVSWTDNSGNLWLFGGFGYTSNGDFGFLNDLWKYSPATNMWTWVKGDNTIDKTGVYGTQGNAHINNKPGGRYGSKTWTDSNGNLWLFGGYGFDGSMQGILNDLWKYDPSTNKWTWIKGDNIVNQPGVYGIQGVANNINKPGARYVSTSWTDSNDNLWLFGGYGYDGSSSGVLSDLWKYNPATNEWTWVKGNNIIEQKAVYGQKDVANVTNSPGARYISTSWVDVSNNLWLFGGYGYDENNQGYLNDLWKYDPSSNKWTWVKGDNVIDQLGVYGTQGLPSTFNKSGARTSSVSWTDGGGNLWMFGGYGYDGNTSGVLNDLWMISDMSVLPIRLFSFNGILNNNTVTLQWQTEQELNFSHFTIQRSFDGNSFTSIGNINAIGTINKNNYSYQDNVLHNWQSSRVFYRLQLANKDGSYTYSRIILFDINQTKSSISIFPNPVVNSLNLFIDQNKAATIFIEITDMKGIMVKKQTEYINAGRVSISLDVNNLPSAIYIVTIRNNTGTIQQKFVKQ